MLVDLVRVTTADGVRLDGALHWPPGRSQNVPFHLVLFVHGTGGSFYSSTLFEAIADRALQNGVAAMAVNTRGHDLVSTAATDEGSRRQGAAYEDVSRCRQDISAWLDYLVARGLTQVVLAGHSSGAVKAIYSQATRPHEAVVRIAAISPPRLSHAWFAASEQAGAFFALFTEAQSLVEQGRGEQLMDVRFPLPYLVTAAGFIDKYGTAERYNVVPLLPRLKVPTMVTYGGREVASNVAFRGMPDEVAQAREQNGLLSVNIIADADHFYSGHRAELVDCLFQWSLG